MDPRLLIHPGEILKEEFLVPFALSANRLAKAIGVPTNRITEIIKGTRGITGDPAVLLGHALGHHAGVLAESAVPLRTRPGEHARSAGCDPPRGCVQPGTAHCVTAGTMWM